MRFLLALVLSLGMIGTASAVEVVGDVVPEVVQCRVYEDGTDVGLVNAVAQECAYNIDNISNGPHRYEMTAIADYGVFGKKESAKSVPLDFVKPGQPAAPGTLRLR